MGKKLLGICITAGVLTAVVGFCALMLPKLVADSIYAANGSVSSSSPAQGASMGNKLPKPRAQAILDGMSLEEKVGQMFFARCPDSDAAAKVSQYHIGGYLLFARDFQSKSRQEVTNTLERYQNQAKVPLLLGVDEEGGTVNRISKYRAFRAVPFHSPQELYQEGGWPLIESDTAEKCKLLRSLGINVNFAPVCDVPSSDSDYIYPRSFGEDPELTSDYVRTVTQTMRQQDVAAVLKHFPGYGNNEDTHTGAAVDRRSYEQFTSSDFLPFQAGIDAGADMVLVSHNTVMCMDSQFPASLSPQVHRILREDLGFAGVIICDDLDMDAIRQYAGEAEAAVLAVQGGNDMLCCTNFEVQIPALIEAVQSGEISQEQIDASVLRILNLKIRLGLIA